MAQTANSIIMNQDAADAMMPGESTDVAAERKLRKERLSAALRAFGKFGFDEGVAGHITVRDPEHLDHFWVNPMGRSFKQMRVSDLLLVNHKGEVVEGEGLLNGAAFTIHSQIHMANPEVTAALRRFARASQLVTGDIRCNDKHFTLRAHHHQPHRHTQCRSRTIAGLLELHHPAALRQTKQTVNK